MAMLHTLLWGVIILLFVVWIGGLVLRIAGCFIHMFLVVVAILLVVILVARL